MRTVYATPPCCRGAGMPLAGVLARPCALIASSIRVIRLVGSPLRTSRRGLCGLYLIVAAYPPLELCGYLPVVSEGWAPLNSLLIRRNLQELSLVIHAHKFYRDEGRGGAQEAHLDTYVLWLVVLVYEQIVYLADLLVVLVVNLVV